MSNDFHIAFGKRLRRYRRLRGLTQQELGGRLGISFQQLQKYETGANKLTFERVCLLSRTLDVPLHAWVEDGEISGPPPSIAEEGEHRQALWLLHAYHTIADESHRRLLCALAQALAGKQQEAQ